MNDQKTVVRMPPLPEDTVVSAKSEREGLELKIAELTGAAEYLSQSIAISQGHTERLQKEVEDLQRARTQAETEYKTQEQRNATMRLELHDLDKEIKKNESTISGQQERLRILGETIELVERRSKQTIESFQEETGTKLKAIKQEFESEKERYSIELETHKNQTQTEMRLLTEELERNRKKQLRAFEVEFQDLRKKADETVAKLLQDGRSKNEALIKATEATALEVHRESESAAKRLIMEANQKAADIIRTAQHEAEDVRRRTHNAEVSFLKEKNSGLAELKHMVANAKQEAQNIIAAAQKEAAELVAKVEMDNEAKIVATNNRNSQARKATEKEQLEFLDRSNTEWSQKTRTQEEALARKVKETEEYVASERKKLEEEARTLLASARERAHAIVETANNEKTYKYEELKALEVSMTQTAKQNADNIMREAEKIALQIVEEARTRTRNVEKIVEPIVAEARDQAEEIRVKADEYAQRIKRELPDPEKWDAELAKLRLQEQERLQSLIEPTVKNYLKAIDGIVSDIFMELPSKYQKDKVIQEFAEAIANIQNKKNYIRFADMIPRLSVVQQAQQPVSNAPAPLNSQVKRYS